MISESLEAWLRPSRTSQPNTRTMIKYKRRTDTNRDLAPTRRPRQTAAHRPASSFDAVQAMTHPAPPVNGPWRVLVLDRDPVDPKWILALLVDPGDVTPADPANLFTERSEISA